MRRWWFALLLAGCGRIGFDANGAAGTGDGGSDGPTSDTGSTLEDGLRLWMPFDVGDPLREVVTNQLATCSSCGSPSAGPRGDGAVAFDGATTCLEFPDSPAYEAQEFTLAAWVFYEGGNSGTVVGKALSGLSNSYELWMRLNAVTRIEFNTTTASTNNDTVNGMTLVLDRWYHLAGTYTGSTKRLYVDGVEHGSSTPDAALLFSDQPFRIGCDEDNGTVDQHFAGEIADVRYYDRALTPAEVAELATL